MTLEETYASLNEGINDPGIFKAVFMAGGPGSGKSLIAKKLGFHEQGTANVEIKIIEEGDGVYMHHN